LSAAELLAKADRAALSAKMLFEAGDADGACNRAYYAMFDAARALLISAGQEVGKTHSSVISAFGNSFVKKGTFPPEMGRVLREAEAFRMAADYRGSSVQLSDAKAIVDEALAFVAAAKIASSKP
jgi:uncharacterized protein (UPF0332 family)